MKYLILEMRAGRSCAPALLVCHQFLAASAPPYRTSPQDGKRSFPPLPIFGLSAIARSLV